MINKIKKWWGGLRLTIKSTLISSCVAIILGIISIVVSSCALGLANKDFIAKYTPDLRVYVRSQDIYVGDGSRFNRIDNVIDIPLAIVNKGYGLAKNIKLAIIYNDSTGDKETNPILIPALEGGKPSFLPDALQSILANAHNIYSSSDKTFKMKIFLMWEDAHEKRYESVESFKLYKTESYSDYPSRFIFVSLGNYKNIENPLEFKKYSIHKIDF